jgi:uncharacterized protein
MVASHRGDVAGGQTGNQAVTLAITNTLKTLAVVGTAFAATIASASANVRIERVTFDSRGETVVGHLYIPADASARSPAVTILGPMTFAKEQAPSQYARRLAERGFVTLVFDPRFRGESSGATRFLESPAAKAEDMRASVSFLRTLNFVDAGAIHALGICQGSTATLRAVADDRHINAVATIAGHYLSPRANREWLGEGLEARLERGRAARATFERTGEVIIVPAVDRTRMDVGMPGQFVWAWYQPWADRGVWQNHYAVMSDAALLEFDVLEATTRITQPYMMIHSDNSFLPDAARRTFASVGSSTRELRWEGATGHFQYYEDAATLDATTDTIATWFRNAR